MGWSTATHATVPCGPVKAAKNATFYDYSDKSRRNTWHLRDVYDNHFRHILSELKKPRPYVPNVFTQIKYILSRIPNHYPTLEAYGRLYAEFPSIRQLIRKDSDLNRYRPMTPECVFDRAFRFHPEDPKLRLLYGLFFYRSKKLERALQQFKIAAKMSPDWAEVFYNIGLVYFRQKNYSAARVNAKKAYTLGYPLAGLRNRLKKAGAWP